MIKDYEDLYKSKWYDNNGLCPVCKKPYCFGSPQLAHRIPKTKAWLKKYGDDIIDHDLNLELVCSLECNASVLIDKKDLLRENLITKIKETL